MIVPQSQNSFIFMGGAVKQVGCGRHEEWNVPQPTDLNGRGEPQYKTCVAVFFPPHHQDLKLLMSLASGLIFQMPLRKAIIAKINCKGGTGWPLLADLSAKM